MCGAVRFVARDVPGTFGVCHCPMCQKWAGGALFEVSLPEAQVSWEGEVKTFASSALAERAFCGICGSALYFRMTEQNEWSGTYDIPLGLFDDTAGFAISHEIYVDRQVVQLADQGQTRLTRADCVAKFPALATL